MKVDNLVNTIIKRAITETKKHGFYLEEKDLVRMIMAKCSPEISAIDNLIDFPTKEGK